MSTVVVRRGPRVEAPAMPTGSEQLQEPPVVPDPAPPDLRSMMMFLPMGLGPVAMVLVYSSSGSGGSPIMYIMSGAMALGMVGMGLSMIGRAAAERKRKLNAERRDFLRYITQLRVRARAAGEAQRTAVLWDNPDPSWLWSVASGPRLWERRGSHSDFGRVRMGLGRRAAVVEMLSPETKPVEDLEPLSAISLRRFSENHRVVNGIPVAVGLRNFSSVEIAGDPTTATEFVRALLGQLVTLHAPDELLVAVLVDEAHQGEWDWVKWLPHTAHPTARDAAGPLRMLACDHDELLDLLGDDVLQRGEHDPSSFPSAAEPFVVVLAHRCQVPATSPLRGTGLRGVNLLDITGELPGGASVLRLTCRDGRVEYAAGDDVESVGADALSLGQSERLARLLAPQRTGGTIDVADRPFESDFELTTLLGIKDAHNYDVTAKWRGTIAQRARMQVPIGVTESGEVVQLDLKEPAQGGVGPHGMLIGSTGSGKSELLRTLVCSLAATHSSEILNFVLIDFKGGATFLGMHRLPHTSATITNLSDELPLVDRMQDSINGEMTRRQELLREAGYPSQFDYEKARAGGAQIPALPTLLVVVDEFSELLSAKPEFMDLFVSIGRLGRSLGVHLLLASQRLDEGRIHRVEGHLSYRIALRTFSSMESRSVIGVADAYELPSAPGNGFIKTDNATLQRFKGAYVSGSCPVPVGGPSKPEERPQMHVVDFATQAWPTLHQLPVTVEDDGPAEVRPTDSSVDPVRPDADTPSLADVLIDRLEGSGPAARQVWLPPLAEAPTLDALLPSVLPHPALGMTVDDSRWRSRLQVPLGLVDLPYEQTRELLVADLSGADGHVGVVGAPQSGKSTLLRTLVLGLALTHTPRDVQIYALDLAGGGLQSISGLPHVGAVSGRLARDRVTRTVDEVVQVMERRELQFAEHGLESMAAFRQARRAGRIDDPHGDVFLVVDGWSTLRAEYDVLESRFTEIASRGLSLGIHLVIGSGRWSDMRPWLRDVLGTRLELRLGDPMDSEIRGRVAQTVPHQPGRGLTSSGTHFIAALPRLDGSSAIEDLAVATRTATEEMCAFWPGDVAPGVRLLPGRLPTAELPSAEGSRVCLGIDEQRLAPVWHDFRSTPHLLTLGDEETGKTNALRLVARAIVDQYAPTEARFLLGDSRRQLDDDVPAEYRSGHAVAGDTLAELASSAALTLRGRIPGADIPPDRLARRDWWQGADLFVLVDDYELLPGSNGVSPLEPLLPLLAQGVHIGLHVVLARSSANAMRGMMDPVVRRLWELGSPALLFSYPKEEGKFIGEATPRTLPPGRAQLVTRRGVRLIQTGLASVTTPEPRAVPV